MCEKKISNYTTFYFDQNVSETARANATIRKSIYFVLDFAPQNVQNHAVVADLDQFACSADTTKLIASTASPILEGISAVLVSVTDFLV